MIHAIADYFARLTAGFGNAWVRFWFVPRDTAALSAMRLLIGAVVVYLHATLALDLVEFFGPDGLLPVADIAPLEGASFSYLNYLYSPAELWTVHLIGLAVLILFTAGFQTRLTSILALIVFLSDIHRAPMITSRTEPIAAMLLAYLCLAPCGKYYSLDRWLARRAGAARLATFDAGRVTTMATISTRLIQIHLALWVAMMGFSKLTGEIWWTGVGTWWLIARPDSRLINFTWLHAYPKLIDVWTHAIVLFELAFPILVWVPLARPLMLAAAAITWTSLALLTGETTFSLALCIAAVAFVQPRVVQACFPGDRASRNAAA